MPMPFRIAVVLETFAEHGRAIMRGVADYLDRGSNWELHSIPLGRSHTSILTAALRADGVITRPYLDEMVDVLQASGKPTVAVHYRGDVPIPSVTSNPMTIAGVAIDHFVDQGFRQVAFFGAPDKRFSLERAEAFEILAAKHGCTYHALHAGRTEPEDIDWHSPDDTLVNWLRSLPKPIGILCCNDVVAQQLLLASSHAQVRIPDDAAVVGIDNDEMVCRLTTPRLSSIDYSGELIGFTAAAMLDQLLQGRTLAERRVRIAPARLVVRQSSDVLAVHDPNVADAIRFIRENTRKRLCVEDVLDKVPVARRTLERAFRKLLGRSIHEEIIESRVRRAKQLLVDTTLPLPDVAESCGFCNRAHLGEVFKECTGHAPASFRREFRARF